MLFFWNHTLQNSNTERDQFYVNIETQTSDKSSVLPVVFEDNVSSKDDRNNSLHFEEETTTHDDLNHEEYRNKLNQIRDQISILTTDGTANYDDVVLRQKPTDAFRRSTPRKLNEYNHRRSLDFAHGLVNADELIRNDDIDDQASTSSTPPPLPVSRPPTIVSTIFKAEIDPHNETQTKRKSLRSVQFSSTDTEVFKPIQLLHSNENLSIAVIKPIPRYPSMSKSTQDLSTVITELEFGFGPMTASRSSDDLLMPDVDGLRRSMRSYRRWKMRSLDSMSSIDDQETTEIVTTVSDLQIDQPSNDRPVLVAATRKPLPLPRNNDRDSIKFVYVFDKTRKEFVQEDCEHGEVPLNQVTISLSNPNLAVLPSTYDDKSVLTDSKSKRKFAFFGLGQKKSLKHHFGSQQQLPTVMDESHPLYRIRSMEDVVETTNSVMASSKSKFYVPNPIVSTRAQSVKMCK